MGTDSVTLSRFPFYIFSMPPNRHFHYNSIKNHAQIHYYAIIDYKKVIESNYLSNFAKIK